MADDTLRPEDETEARVDEGAAAASDQDAPDPAATDAETPPKPKRRARKKADADDGEDKPKRRSRKKADAEEADESPEPDAAEKPKRRSRKKADADGEDTPKRRSRKASEPDASADEEPAAEAAASDREEDERPRRRRRTRSAEPVASSDAPETHRDDDEDRPSRTRSRRRNRDAGDSESSSRSSGGDASSDDASSDDEPKGRRTRSRDEQGDDGQPQGDGRRGRKRRNRKKNRGDQNQGGQNNGHPGQEFEGILELIGDKKFGFIRGFKTSLQKGDNDPFMPPPLIQKHNLRDGVKLTGMIKPGRKGAWQVSRVDTVMDQPVEDWEQTEDFDEGMVVYPDDKLQLVTEPSDVSMRVIDLVAPMGKGQRALIVAPPRAGKTVLLKGIAAGLAQNHPGIKLIALLIDERPEEVTDFIRNTDATVFASSNDYGEDNHVRVATLAFEYSRRLVEQGHDVVMLIDSLTRLGRTFNLFGGNSGRTMSGGLDARALLMPRKIFGAARNIEGGGSLTMIATALIETGSRMDDVIFEEFKGTGNAEVVLDRELSEKRVYPAINIRKSGTRNEDRLVPEEHLRQRHMLLRALNSRHPVEAMQALTKQIQMSPTNVHLLNELIPETA